MAKFKLRKKVTKINLRIISKPHAYLQSMVTTSVKFQENRNKTVGGVAHTRCPQSIHFIKREITLTEWAPSPLNLPERKNMGPLNCPPPFRRKAEGHSFWLSILPSVLPSPYRSMYLMCATPPTVLFRLF